MDYTLPIFDRLQNCWDPITEDQLRQLEDDLDVDFPDDYREFLLRFNAGYWPHVVKTRALHPGGTLDEIGIDSNLGIIPDHRFTASDILHTAEAYSDRIPENLVPIMDAMGDPVCIDLSEENYGKVYYWDRSHEGIERDDRANLIADSFTEFLLSLTPYTELETWKEELPVFQSAERGDRKAVLKYLIDCGKPDIRNAKGWTLLMCAARNSWPRIVEMLYNGGAKPNALDPDGWSPLHHAVWGQSFDSVKHLLAAGADTDYRDSQGRNLAQIAKEEHHYRLYYHLAPYMPYP
ncbi:MAG: SMI1/KNR4 family protein [Pirellulales bacterium]